MAACDSADWSRLFHAYSAAADTPEHLQALLAGGTQERDAAIEHLYGSVLHQGTVYPATAVAVRVVAGILGDDRLRTPGPSGTLLLAELLRWVGDAFDSARYIRPVSPDPVTPAEVDRFFEQMEEEDLDAWGSDVVGALHAQGEQALLDAAPAVVGTLLPFVTDEDALVRQLAIGALGNIAGLASVDAELPTVRNVLQERLQDVTDRDERCELVLALAEAGVDVSPWLSDADPAVRACAALGLPDSPAATAVLLDALKDPGAADEWFAERPTRFQAHVRFHLLENLLGRGLPFADLLPTAVRLVRMASHYTVDSDIAPLLKAAFPGAHADSQPGTQPPPTDLKGPQRDFLKALVANEGLWDPRNGNAHLAFMRVGLPHDRRAVADIANGRGHRHRWFPRRSRPSSRA